MRNPLPMSTNSEMAFTQCVSRMIHGCSYATDVCRPFTEAFTICNFAAAALVAMRFLLESAEPAVALVFPVTALVRLQDIGHAQCGDVLGLLVAQLGR